MKPSRTPKRVASRDFQVVLHADTDVGGYVVSCPLLPGCYSQGDTVEAALENMREAILLTIEDMKAQGEPIPHPALALIGSVTVSG